MCTAAAGLRCRSGRCPLSARARPAGAAGAPPGLAVRLSAHRMPPTPTSRTGLAGIATGPPARRVISQVRTVPSPNAGPLPKLAPAWAPVISGPAAAELPVLAGVGRRRRWGQGLGTAFAGMLLGKAPSGTEVDGDAPVDPDRPQRFLSLGLIGVSLASLGRAGACGLAPLACLTAMRTVWQRLW